MATLLLQVAGTAVGTMLGGPIGAAIGSAIGGVAGGMIDRALFGGTTRAEGPRLKTLDGITAAEGAPIPRVYGRVRLGGQVIWATKFEEMVETTRQGRSGGKSTGGSVKTTTYSYFANLAVALCEGPVAMVRRIWADGKPLDLAGVTLRIHRGDEGQTPDPLILARQGASPAYRGTAYVVFERLPLADYGNRLPQLSFEVVRPVDGLAQLIRGVNLIPGATEFGYQTAQVTRDLGLGSTAAENRNQLVAATDLDGSLDALQAICPNAASVALVVSWFGDDLRAGNCKIRPGVDSATKQTFGAEWSVAGVDRANARLVSQIDGRAAYGGTPSDASVLSAIAELKARGRSVVFYPFVMMDIASGNGLEDPWGGVEQAPFPWRGRITCHPAPGRPGTVDGASAANVQIANFFGAATAAHFGVVDGAVVYTGPNQWSYSRFVLHNAALAAAAGGVDAFIIGSELLWLTRVRSTATGYAAAARLKTLAGHVRALLGPSVKIGYAADWTEYGAHVRNGGADVGFPLDNLWSDANIDFVGIDYYPPVADWRDGVGHLDALAGASGRDLAYLKDRLGAGEAFDWYYASDADRAAQNRTPITDGFGKAWMFRAKDLVGWWSNRHRWRMGGVEQTNTTWIAQSKPIWLTEIGCPAVDKGANAPNLFPDPKSSESGYPAFSSEGRDDLIQARLIKAVIRRFDPALAGFEEAHNPASTVYSGRMVDAARTHVWAWDARPFPAFPHLASVWGDAPNWRTGHWINGRIEGMPLDRLIAQICADYALPMPALARLDGFLDGYVIDRPMSARAAIEPLARLFAADIAAVASGLRVAGRGRGARLALAADDLVPDRKGRSLTRTRAQETELPRQIGIGFSDGEAQYRRITAVSRRLDTTSRLEETAETTAVLSRHEGERLADQLLQDVWSGREVAEFDLRPGLAALECGDLVGFPDDAASYLVTRIADGAVRRCEARRVEPAIFEQRPRKAALAQWTPPPVAGAAFPVVLSPPVDPSDPTTLALLALRAEPWVGPYTVWRSLDGTGFAAVATIDRSAVIGETLTDLAPGAPWRWDRRGLDIRLAGGALSSLDEMTALGDDHLIALGGPDGFWEILAFRDAVPLSPGVWRIGPLIRGRYGSEPAAARPAPAGSRIVLLDVALTPLFSGAETLGHAAQFRISPAGRDHADPAAVAFGAAASPAALLPLSPVHARARRTPAGVEIGWVRRTRRGGDNWEPAEVPLSEASESYLVEILDLGAVRRGATVSAPAYLYPAAAEIADFGTPQAALSVRIRQIGAAAGPGAALSATLPVLPG